MKKRSPTKAEANKRLLAAAKAMFEPGAHGFQLLRDAIADVESYRRKS